MDAAELAKQAFKFLVATFGKDLLLLTKDFLQHQWSRLFASQSVLFLGPRSSGKSSIIQYLQTGKPFEIDKSGATRSPDPTLAAAIVDERASVQKKSWLHIKQDLPGDQQLRATWKQAVEDFHPTGIVYLIDGQDESRLVAQTQEACREVLDVCYPDGPRELRAFHIFISFADVWATSPLASRARERAVRGALDDAIAERPAFAGLRTDVAVVHLSPNAKEWDAARRALQRFGTDLSA